MASDPEEEHVYSVDNFDDIKSLKDILLRDVCRQIGDFLLFCIQRIKDEIIVLNLFNLFALINIYALAKYRTVTSVFKTCS